MSRHANALFLSLLSAVLLICSFPNPQISILAWVALVPLFFAIDSSSVRASFFLSFLAGIFFFSGFLYWLAYVTKPGYFIIVFYLGLYFGILGLLAGILINKFRASKIAFLIFLILPALWVSLEFIRGFLFTGFPWGILGYTQYRNPIMIQISDITGPYGVSFIIVMVNVVTYACLSNLFRKAQYFRALRPQLAVSVIIIIAVMLYGYLALNEDDLNTGIKLSVVQGNIEQAKKWSPQYKDHILDRYEALTLQATGDLIIWPETSVPGFLDEKDTDPRIRAIARKSGAPLFLGVVTHVPGEEEDHYFNSAALFSPAGNIEKRYDKIHLVPLGEYVPFERYIPFFRDFIDVPIGDYTAGEEFTVFDIESKSGARFKYAALICFEDIFPGLVRRFALLGSDFAINITNDAWFKESSEQLQHAQASVFRAVENRISVVRAANTGFSCYINPKGIIEDSIRDAKTGSMYTAGQKAFELKVSGRKNTFYAKFGDLFAYLCILGTLLALTKVNSLKK